jgi:hypothetical protein
LEITLQPLIFGVLLFAGGTAVFLATLLWERQMMGSLLKEDPRQFVFEERLARLEWTRTMIEWVRLIGALGALGGLLLCMW